MAGKGINIINNLHLARAGGGTTHPTIKRDHKAAMAALVRASRRLS